MGGIPKYSYLSYGRRSYVLAETSHQTYSSVGKLQVCKKLRPRIPPSKARHMTLHKRQWAQINMYRDSKQQLIFVNWRIMSDNTYELRRFYVHY
jgi:hypothetical protein